MSISIIGAGQVGMALAEALSRKGEQIYFGVPDPEKYRAAVQAVGPQHRVGTVHEALAANDLAILAVPFAALNQLASIRADWQGQIVVDASNPLAPGLSGLLVGTHDSGAEQLARAAHGARVVKAFNTTGAENMRNSQFNGGLPCMPICGDDADARNRAIALATLIGFEAVDLGGLKAARYLEPFAMTWIHLAIKCGFGRNFAFSVLRR